MTDIIKVQFEDVDLTVQPHPEHEWLIAARLVAAGYGVNESTVRKHKERHQDELLLGKHFVSVTNSHANGAPMTLWTKRGVVRLGFFIKSERAKHFRDWAEELVLQQARGQADFAELERLAGLTVRAIENSESRLRAEMDQRFMDTPIRMHSSKRAHVHALGQELGKCHPRSFRGAWHMFKEAFGMDGLPLAAYDDLPQGRYDEAVAWLKLQIEAYGKQTRLIKPAS